MKSKHAASLLFGTLATWVFPGIASASDPDPKTFEQAKRLLLEAAADYGGGRYEESRTKLERACSMVHSANCVHNLAAAEFKTGRPLEAYRHFREAYSNPSATWLKDEAVVSETHKMMSEAYAAIGHIVIQAPEGASVTVDGQPVNASKDPVDVQPGSHFVEGRLGAQLGREQVDAKPGTVETVTLRLEPLPASAPLVASPAIAAPIERPEDRAPTASADRQPDTARWVTSGALLGLGAAGLVLGGVFYANASSDLSKWQSLSAQTGVCPPQSTTSDCTSLNNALDSRANNQRLGSAFVATGSALLIAGVATWIVWPLLMPNPNSHAGFASPVVYSSGGGAAFYGSF
jgi:hypothetical protein